MDWGHAGLAALVVIVAVLRFRHRRHRRSIHFDVHLDIDEEGSNDTDR